MNLLCMNVQYEIITCNIAYMPDHDLYESMQHPTRVRGSLNDERIQGDLPPLVSYTVP